jgi:hypothetical protein
VIETAAPGVLFCEHLPRLAKMADRLVPVRTVNHNVIDEHAAAVNRMHTGRQVSGSVVYPSIGSLVTACRGPIAEGVPPYVVIGYPSATRGPGFLGPKAGYVYLTDTDSGPAALTRPAGISDERQKRREALLEGMRQDFVKRNEGDKLVRDYDDAIAEGFRLQRGDFMQAFDLKSEAGALREDYGDEFGQRCLLARRLLQRGVRFVEVGFNLNFVNGAGWDTHNAAQKEQHGLIRRLDQGVAALLGDLEKQRLLDKTLVVIATEFGRPAAFDAGGGRGHYGKCFTCVLAGGGLRTGQAVGVTDELAMNIVEEPCGVPDLFATILATLGVNPAKNLMDGERPGAGHRQGRRGAQAVRVSASSSPHDSLGRPLRDLRLSVTDRCNFRCAIACRRKSSGTATIFCRKPTSCRSRNSRGWRGCSSGSVWKSAAHRRRTAVAPRSRAARRPNRRAGWLHDLALTTNGASARAKGAGRSVRPALRRLTVSLDALDDATFRTMNDVDFPVARVLEGIDAALATGFAPIKITWS